MRKTPLFKGALLSGLLIAVLALMATPVAAGSFNIYVGYADGIRAGAFFPNPWYGDSSVQYFIGNDSSPDSGAIRIENTGATAIVINGLTVTTRPSASPTTYNIWNGAIGVGLILNPGMNAIFDQTTYYNFDTSEDVLVAANLVDNCSTGLTAATALCVNNAPQVNVNIDAGGSTTYLDTGHVLDTGGFDLATFGNESLQWRLIGTTGVNDPGGLNAVPEPASMVLLGSGLAAFALRRRFARR